MVTVGRTAATDGPALHHFVHINKKWFALSVRLLVELIDEWEFDLCLTGLTLVWTGPALTYWRSEYSNSACVVATDSQTCCYRRKTTWRNTCSIASGLCVRCIEWPVSLTGLQMFKTSEVVIHCSQRRCAVTASQVNKPDKQEPAGFFAPHALSHITL